MNGGRKGRPKGAFKTARTRHVEQQALFDAIKSARGGGEVYVNAHGQRYRLSAPASDPSPFAFVSIRGRVRLCHVTDKDGLWAAPVLRMSESSRTGMIPACDDRVRIANVLCWAYVQGCQLLPETDSMTSNPMEPEC